MKSKLLVLACTLLFLGACQSKSGSTQTMVTDTTDIRLVMSYRPDVQFTPFYVADARGYFIDNGIKVDFEHIAESESVQLVGAGEIPFAIVSGEQVLLARAQGLPVVYVMAWWQDYPIAVAAPRDLGIDEPKKLAGKRVGFPGVYGASYIGLRALLSANGMSEEDIKLEATGFTQVETLYERRVDAAVVYANNEPLQLEALGFPVDVIRVADYVHLTSNGLITSEKVLKENPDLVRRMIRAILHGIEDTIQDPASAYTIAQDYVEGLVDANEDVQRAVLAASIQFWLSDTPGYSDPEAWENMQSILLEMEFLGDELDLRSAFSNDYLP